MGDSFGAHGAPGHFNNETDRHTEVYNSRNNGHHVQGLYLYDQQQPYRGREMPTMALQVGTVFGQARIVDAEAVQADGSASIPYIRQNASSSGQDEHNSESVAATHSLEPFHPEILSAPNRQPSPLFPGVTVREQVPNLPSRTSQDDFSQYHGQSCSGLSDVNINRLAPQLLELPSTESNAVQLHRQDMLEGATCEQAHRVVPEDNVEPLNMSMLQAVLISEFGNGTFQDNWVRCYTSCIKAGFDEQTANAFANHRLYIRQASHGDTVECLHCNGTQNMNGSFIHRYFVHGQDCPVLKSLQKVNNSANASNTNGVRQLGACGGNGGLSNPPAETACKKPDRQASVPPQYSQQVSEATAVRRQDVFYHPNDENQHPNPAALTSLNMQKPGEEYVRAESPEMFVSSQNRNEARNPGHYGANISTPSSSISLTHSSIFGTASSSSVSQTFGTAGGSSVSQTFGTARGSSVSQTLGTARGPSASQTFGTSRGSSVSQGGGDRNNSSLQNFVSAAQQRVRHPEFQNLQARFLSFLKLPKEVTQSVQTLAEAGMFYTGYKDTCRCFYCGGDLHSWEPDDDPWQEHAQHYPDCGFVRQEKGQDFIDSVKKYKVKSQASKKVDTLEREVEMCKAMGFENGQVQRAVEKYKRGVEAGRISRQPDKLNEILNILDEMSRTEETGQSQAAERSASLNPRPNSMDARYCSACKRQKATVAQQKCGHVVCKECAPKLDDKEPRCKFCQQEVVECNPVDTSFFH